MRNGFSNTFTSSCREHAHLLNTTDFNSFRGIFSERSGIVNIGLEGTMVIGAFASAVFNLAFASQFGSWTPWVALIVAAVAGMLYSAIHAFATALSACRPYYFRDSVKLTSTCLNRVP